MFLEKMGVMALATAVGASVGEGSFLGRKPRAQFGVCFLRVLCGTWEERAIRPWT